MTKRTLTDLIHKEDILYHESKKVLLPREQEYQNKIYESTKMIKSYDESESDNKNKFYWYREMHKSNQKLDGCDKFYENLRIEFGCYPVKGNELVHIIDKSESLRSLLIQSPIENVRLNTIIKSAIKDISDGGGSGLRIDLELNQVTGYSKTIIIEDIQQDKILEIVTESLIFLLGLIGPDECTLPPTLVTSDTFIVRK